MRKLIIGCGYLGRRVAAAWIGEGHYVTALTRTAENAEQLRNLGIEPVRGDVTDRPSLSNLPDADSILYAVGFDRRSGLSQRRVYVDGLNNVLQELARRSNPTTRTSRFLYISSTSVYGQTSGEWVDETSPCEPTTPNGQVCLDAERVLRTSLSPTDATSSFAANILRLAGLYGPGRLLRRLDALRSRQPLEGNPDGYLNLIHVDDAVQAVLACETHGSSGETYLICDDQPIRRREYYETLARLAGTPSPVFAEAVETPSSSAQDVNLATSANRRCRNRRLHEELEVRLMYPGIATGLAQAIAAT